MQVRTITMTVAVAVALTTGVVACGSDGDEPTGASGVQTTAPAESSGGSTSEAPAPSEPLAEVEGVEVLSVDEPMVLIPRAGDDHLWLAERAGVIRRVAVSDDGTSLEPVDEPVLDISDDTTTDLERGLLGMAFSPDGSQLFVSHTNIDGNTRLLSYDVEGDEVVTDSRQELLAVDQPFPNHNGGHVVWGPDDQLWFGLGDGGAGDDPDNRAQDPDDLLGKILRIDPSGKGDPEIVVSGARNPWRFAFDTDDSLWIADVGQNAIEEINHLPADEIDGTNLGWSGYEGSEPYLDGDGRRPDDPTMPVFEYGREGGNCSVIGGFPYRGTALKGLQGAFLFVDYCVGAVRAVQLDDDGKFAAEIDLGVDVANPASFGVDADGEPFVLSGSGQVVKLVPAG